MLDKNLYSGNVYLINPRGTDEFILGDTLYGFEKDLSNIVLENLNTNARKKNKILTVKYNQILSETTKSYYSNLKIFFDLKSHEKLLGQFMDYKRKRNDKEFQNFLCCFNGSNNVSRQFLVAILHKTKLWNDQYCTKLFEFDWQSLDGNLENYIDKNYQLINKFFLDYNSNFNKKIFNKSYLHGHNLQNLYKLENLLENSFVNIVSESLATSYYPNVSEKFCNSIATKSLFLTYGQPNWHSMIENYHGFRLYNKIFDYEFDSIQNPVLRLIKLIEMILKFQHLSVDDWHDLYLMEKDTIEHNYEHYYSKSYLKNLAKFI